RAEHPLSVSHAHDESRTHRRGRPAAAANAGGGPGEACGPGRLARGVSAADAVLVLHAAFVLFVVLGLAAIWIGAALGRPFAFNPWFRGTHLAAIAFVVVQPVLGYLCPLTIWEDQLRGQVTEQ